MRLTSAERELLPYLGSELSLAEIAERLGLAPATAKKQVVSIYRKLGATSRGDAVQLAILNDSAV